MNTVVWKLRETNRAHRTITIGSIFSHEEIQKIKDLGMALKTQPSLVGTQGINNKIRKCQIKWLAPNEDCFWVYRRLVDVIQKVNSQYFNFNLYGIQTLQYTIYNAKDNEFYGPHKDTLDDLTENLTRKLTFSIQLTDPSEYEGGDLVIDTLDHPKIGSKVFGDTIFFLADSVHEAKPVTKGERHVLVGWVVGPPVV